MRLFNLGEFGLIERIVKQFAVALPPGFTGPGDDCAILPGQGGLSTLVTTDLLIEDVHFLRREISARDLGHKALAVNLSDIAAMGGTPRSFFLSIGFPPDLKVDWVDSFIEGMSELAQEHGVCILGGDTTKSPGPIVVNITVVGDVISSQVKLRSTARPGDIIAVTDFLGDSAAGLKTILEKTSDSAEQQELRKRHHRPHPQIREGQWLGARSEVHAMMDVSDGLNSDVRHIMDRSHWGARIELSQLPVSPELMKLANDLGWDVHDLAAAGGEDYCLLCTVDSVHFADCARDFQRQFVKPLHRVGEITDRTNMLEYLENGHATKFSPRGFEHFFWASGGGGI
jgi:thiamine-monophosphate kinase